jgi:alpha-N-arabinofuranosidase
MRPQKPLVSELGTASVLLAFLRHADRVKIACLTSGIHCLVDREQHPLRDLIKYGRGLSLECAYEGETFDLNGYAVDDCSQNPPRKGLPYIDVAAAYDDASGDLALFAINRDEAEAREVDFDLQGFGPSLGLVHKELAPLSWNVFNYNVR